MTDDQIALYAAARVALPAGVRIRSFMRPGPLVGPYAEQGYPALQIVTADNAVLTVTCPTGGLTPANIDKAVDELRKLYSRWLSESLGSDRVRDRIRRDRYKFSA